MTISIDENYNEELLFNSWLYSPLFLQDLYLLSFTGASCLFALGLCAVWGLHLSQQSQRFQIQGVTV